MILNNIYKYKKNISQSKLPSVPKKNVGNYISSQALQLHYFKGSEELEKFDNLIDQNDLIYKYFEHVMTNEEEINLRKTLSNHFVFKDINPEMLNLVLSELIFFTFPKDKIIYEEGDEGNFFYIIASGKEMGMFWRIIIINSKK